MLTFRMLFAFFPFMVFLMALMGFLNLDEEIILGRLYEVLPADISEILILYVSEIAGTRSTGLLSTSLFFSVYNTANGFRAIISSINAAYGYKDTRGIIKRTGLSLLLMLVFTVSVVVMIVLLIFGGHIWNWLWPTAPDFVNTVLSWTSALVSMLVLASATTFIYKLACFKKKRLMDVLPGATLTVALWVVSSKIFGYFFAHYSRYSTLYGSVAGVFILVLWLNLISLILLIGNEINSVLSAEG